MHRTVSLSAIAPKLGPKQTLPYDTNTHTVCYSIDMQAAKEILADVGFDDSVLVW